MMKTRSDQSSRSYHPPVPEAQSALSLWAVRIELVVTIGVAVAVAVYTRPREEPPPPSFAPPMSRLPESTAIGSGMDIDASESGGDALKGRALFMQSCSSCHGQEAQGLPHMGLNLQQSRFIASTNDLKLIAFLKRGRQPTDSTNTTGVPMPARGGNVTLDDESLADIVAFLRQVQKR